MGLFDRRRPIQAGRSEDPSLFEPKALTHPTEPPTNGNTDHPLEGHRAVEPVPIKHEILPIYYNHNGHPITKGIHPDGESGRAWLHYKHFFHVIWLSSCPVSMMVNVLWPFVPVALALHWAKPEWHVAIFAVNYVAMVPCANLLGFAGQELARKLPKVAGILIETALGSVVEIILFMVLIVKDNGVRESHGSFISVIQAAILGSILTNLLLCLGLCFFIGGMKRSEQSFHATISEIGSGLLLVAGFALLIPSAFYSALSGTTVAGGENEAGGENFTMEKLQKDILEISRGTSIILMACFALYLWFNARTHDSIFAEVLEADEQADADRHRDLAKKKLTFFEAIFAIVISIALIALISVFLVEEIEFIVTEQHVPDNFMGLILVPLVEKTAEHLTSIDEAWDNQIVRPLPCFPNNSSPSINALLPSKTRPSLTHRPPFPTKQNFALFHCLGPSIQTALFNAPLVVIVGWGLGKPMDLNFEIFMIVVLVLSILVVGNFLRDGKSNYLEGALLVVSNPLFLLPIRSGDMLRWPFHPHPH